ncbi:MAG: MATE family efflux transporter [Heyndrickxia sp.]
MKQTYTTRGKFIQLLTILIPILFTQIAMYAMNFFDTMMSGKYAKADLAGVAIGSSLWVPVFTGLSGILLSVTPIIAHLVGAKKKKDVAFSVIQGIYAAIFLAIIILILGSIALDPILQHMNLEAHVRNVAKYYLVALSFGIIPLFIYNVLRSFMDALGMTRVTMIITLLSLPINVALNFLFIFGNGGMPELGGIGSGVASAITYWLIMFIALGVIHLQKPFSNFMIFKKLYAVSLTKWKEIFVLGIPIGLSTFFETSIFAAVTLVMSKYGTNIIAAHQIAINFSSLLYMIPLSISMAMTIVIGFEVGANRFQDARKYSKLGISIAITMAFVLGILLFTNKELVAKVYSNDSKVVALTAHFLLYAVFFQLSDAIQAPVQGALRGYKDVNVTFIMAFISYWIIGLPFGYVIANYTDFGPYGFWLGLIAGLAVGAVTLSLRLKYVLKKKRNNDVPIFE